MKYFYFMLTVMAISLVVTCSNISSIRNAMVSEPTLLDTAISNTKAKAISIIKEKI